MIIRPLTIMAPRPSPPTPPAPTFDEITLSRNTESQTWMSKNLAINDGGTGITIKDNLTANGVNFGTQYYYTWDAAVRIASSIPGWHLPTQAEWNTLVYIVTGTYGAYSIAGPKLKSTTGWNSGNGDGTYEFNVFPVGYMIDGYLYNLGAAADLWTNEESSSNAKYRYLNTGNAFKSSDSSKSRGYSVRLIKDAI